MEWALEPKMVSIQGPLGPRHYASWTVPSLWPQAAAASPPQPWSGGGGGRGGKAAPAAGLGGLQVPAAGPSAFSGISIPTPGHGAASLSLFYRTSLDIGTSESIVE